MSLLSYPNNKSRTKQKERAINHMGRVKRMERNPFCVAGMQGLQKD